MNGLYLIEYRSWQSASTEYIGPYDVFYEILGGFGLILLRQGTPVAIISIP